MLTRRSFLASSAVALGGSALWGDSERQRPRVAFLGTVVRRHSHAQHFLDRICEGYTWNGQWVPPRLDVASVYIDQVPEDDLSQDRIARYGLRQCASIAEALTLGSGQLAVDGVVIIAEHGDYPTNEKGQKRYPRYDWFKQVVAVFEASGRSAPVFNDKHLSTVWEECVDMVADSRRLEFPFLAGSSLPVTWRLPSLDVPFDAPLSESVCVSYGGIDSYDIHGLETAQCMSERRHGGEVGIASVQALKDEAVYARLAREDHAETRKLFISALCCSHNLPVEGGYPTAAVTFDWARKALPQVTAYFIEHRDGFRTSLFMTTIRDFNYAGLRSDTGEVIACQMYLPMPGHSATTADFFNPLMRHIETLVLTGAAPYPVERTLLTSGMVIAGVESLAQGGASVETPEMEVVYQGPTESHFRGATAGSSARGLTIREN
ncbi:MAG: hypothetical protein KDA75_15505 [Planctomycetaceae bacterium]|nr:hypothetical protein [Planctomycetaceae bacterium]